MPDTSTGGPTRDFPTTRWTLIAGAREGPEARRAALEELLAIYWKPLYLRARRKGLEIEAAKDLVQDFAAHLLESDFIERLDPAKGRFRAYMRTALDHFLSNARAREAAQKRGGGRRRVALDLDQAEGLAAAAPDDPDAAYDREWALAVMERATARLRREFAEGKRRGPLDLAFRFFGFGPTAPTYADAAAEAGMSLVQLKAFLHRARQRFRDLVREEVAGTVDAEGDVDAEVAALVRALSPT